MQSIFTTLFGSYFGDWDSPNNLLRASLARGSSLINAWSGRPIWYFHQMAMGHSVGRILLNTINNNGNYYSQFGKLLSSISLLGDPSLKMYYHTPVTDLKLNGTQISWTGSEDTDIVGYSLYAQLVDSSWILIDALVDQTSFDISSLKDYILGVMVRPVVLISSRSGSYYNEGAGMHIDILTTGSKEYQNKTLIYPNPAASSIQIATSHKIGITKIIDLHGRTVIETIGQAQIDVSKLIPGTYALLLENQSTLFIKR